MYYANAVRYLQQQTWQQYLDVSYVDKQTINDQNYSDPIIAT